MLEIYIFFLDPFSQFILLSLQRLNVIAHANGDMKIFGQREHTLP